MGNYNGTQLTALGQNLVALAQAGTQINFTRIALGDGQWPDGQNVEVLTALLNEVMSLPIQQIETAGGTSSLRFVLTNTGLANGFYLREMAIYAEDPADPAQEILYSATYASAPDFLPANNSAVSVENITDLITVVGNAQNVTAVISDTVIIATKEDIAVHTHDLDAHNNLLEINDAGDIVPVERTAIFILGVNGNICINPSGTEDKNFKIDANGNIVPKI